MYVVFVSLVVVSNRYEKLINHFLQLNNCFNFLRITMFI